MQVKVFTVPIIGGESLNDELNVFLRAKKVLSLDTQCIANGSGSFWSFCIKYVEDTAAIERERLKIDYKEVLDEASFKRFARMREVRKSLANTDSVPAYAVFTDEELSNIAKITEPLSLGILKKIKGIGDKKLEKYGERFLKQLQSDETSQ